ncbi:hypothetical protein ACIQ7D_17920 [Streptomyces sp. NPDC096310]|uniref:hypothetical protein n=1 Tax=Streptomyces sp. NPDC096310 TaxID=3366082 RepID=UPI0037F8E29E
MPDRSEPTVLDYLSTGCLHGEHAYCQGATGQAGTKTPAVCKFCAAPCRCDCHRVGAAVEAAVLPRRGDALDTWLEAQRDAHRDDDRGQWSTLDNLLDRYRAHADTGTPLNQHREVGVSPRRATVTITVDAPTPENASQWVQTIADMVAAEYGDSTRLDITTSPG